MHGVGQKTGALCLAAPLQVVEVRGPWWTSLLSPHRHQRVALLTCTKAWRTGPLRGATLFLCSLEVREHVVQWQRDSCTCICVLRSSLLSCGVRSCSHIRCWCLSSSTEKLQNLRVSYGEEVRLVPRGLVNAANLCYMHCVSSSALVCVCVHACVRACVRAFTCVHVCVNRC